MFNCSSCPSRLPKNSHIDFSYSEILLLIKFSLNKVFQLHSGWLPDFRHYDKKTNALSCRKYCWKDYSSVLLEGLTDVLLEGHPIMFFYFYNYGCTPRIFNFIHL